MVQLSKKDVLWNKSKLWKAKDVIDQHRTFEKPSDLKVPTLVQDVWWIDRNKKPHRVEDMSLHHVRNLINFLERRAKPIYAQYQRAYMSSIIKVFNRMNESSGFVDCYTGRQVTLVEFWGDEHAYEFALAEADAFFGNMKEHTSAASWMAATPLLKALYARLGEPQSQGEKMGKKNLTPEEDLERDPFHNPVFNREDGTQR